MRAPQPLSTPCALLQKGKKMPSEGIELETFCVISVSLTKWPSLIDLYIRQINMRQQKTGHIIILRESAPGSSISSSAPPIQQAYYGTPCQYIT